MDVYQTINSTSLVHGKQLLSDKENELVDRLLTVMEMAPRHLDNNCLCAELSLINPSQSHLTAHQLKNFRMYAKRASLQKSLG